MGALYRIALILVIVGAVNWGLIGLFQFDLVATIFGGPDSIISRLIYTLVGVGGLICIPLLSKPLVEEEASTSNASTNRPAYRNPSYQTEFGKEEDFSNSKKSNANKKKNDSNSNK
ncbi:DUF378 domain-containing protein [Lysinibacillus sp. KU-BSD001]|uniref:DUF378 domain-containing protein n=1 Tax=Lysinibacillus sp. KU-BSD001 TaxID=3141328 RepID=UPI0036E0E051